MSCHFQKGKQNRVAFVFSCPGRLEKAAKRPAAGTTGKMLELLLKKLSVRLGPSDFNREDITITNSWKRVLYKATTGRTEAELKEISSPQNIRRLQGELEDITEFVVCCGARARFAVDQCRLHPVVKILYVVHLGARGLNTIKIDAQGKLIVAAKNREDGRSLKVVREENTSRRLDYICNDLIRQLGEVHPSVRYAVWMAHKGLCASCLRAQYPRYIYYKISPSQGGSNTAENLVVLCETCQGRSVRA